MILLRDLKIGHISFYVLIFSGWSTTNPVSAQCLFIVRELIADCMSPSASCPPPGSRVPVQVHRPVSYPVLKSHLRDGGGAVQSEHPRALPVDPLRAESGQPQLREPCVHAGQMIHTLRHFHCLPLWQRTVCLILSLCINVFYLLFYSSSRFAFMINFCFSCFVLVICFTFSFCACCLLMLQSPHCCPLLGSFLDSLGVWSAACLSVVMLWGCLPSQ